MSCVLSLTNFCPFYPFKSRITRFLPIFFSFHLWYESIQDTLRVETELLGKKAPPKEKGRFVKEGVGISTCQLRNQYELGLETTILTVLPNCKFYSLYWVDGIHYYYDNITPIFVGVSSLLTLWLLFQVFLFLILLYYLLSLWARFSSVTSRVVPLANLFLTSIYSCDRSLLLSVTSVYRSRNIFDTCG